MNTQDYQPEDVSSVIKSHTVGWTELDYSTSPEAAFALVKRVIKSSEGTSFRLDRAVVAPLVFDTVNELATLISAMGFKPGVGVIPDVPVPIANYCSALISSEEVKSNGVKIRRRLKDLNPPAEEEGRRQDSDLADLRGDTARQISKRWESYHLPLTTLDLTVRGSVRVLGAFLKDKNIYSQANLTKEEAQTITDLKIEGSGFQEYSFGHACKFDLRGVE